jgi:hypothetical protein
MDSSSNDPPIATATAAAATATAATTTTAVTMTTAVTAKSKVEQIATMKQQLIKLKRIAQLYKDEVGKHKKALTESRTQTQQRNDMIAKLKHSLVAMKEQQQKLKLQLQKSQAAAKGHSNDHSTTNDVLGSRRPVEVLLRIRHNSENWCLVRFEGENINDDDGDGDGDEREERNHGTDGKSSKKEDLENTKWIKQNILEIQTYEQYGLRMEIPEVAFDASFHGGSNEEGGRSVSGLEEELNLTQQNLERVQEEFRRYRVRSEIQKKQKETELNRVMQANLAFQQRRIAGDDGINAKLRESETKVDELSVELKRKSKLLHKIQLENEKCKKENSQLIQLLETGNRRRDSEGIIGKYKALQKEYEEYKSRAIEALKHKDAAIKRALENSNHSKNKKFGSNNGSMSSARVLPRNPTTEYLKNTIIQYMATDQAEVKEHMEAAIATVLQFNDQDMQFLKQRREADGGWVSGLSNYFKY